MPKWEKGQSGNPAGRPKKNRALTEILTKAGNKTIPVGKETRKTARKRVIADLLWELAATGGATMPDGTYLELEPKDWLGVVKWIYGHIDGPPTKGLEVSGTDGGPVAVTVVEIVKSYDDNNTD